MILCLGEGIEMETLEKELKKGDLFSIRAFSNFPGLITGLSGCAHSTKGYCIKTALKNFEEEYSVKMPDISLKKDFNQVINGFLEKGYQIENANLGTIFCFKFDPKRRLYLSTLEIQDSAWIQYIKNNPNDPSFSRELFFGKSKKNLLKAYSDMGENFKRQSQPL